MVEAIVVAVGYSDILAVTLPRNRQLFERILVGTTLEDTATQALCRQHGADCVISSRAHFGGAQMNKGAVQNDVLRVAAKSGWLLFLDADIILPAALPATIDNISPFDRSNLFWMPRQAAAAPADLTAFDQGKPLPVIRKPGKDVGLGYFHLCHAGAATWKANPGMSERFPTAAGVDLEFRNRWRGRWQELPLSCVHVGTPGKNWRGRVTPSWPAAAPISCALRPNSGQPQPISLK